MSNLTAFAYIQENSDSTPGLFNRIFSQLSDNIGTAASGIGISQSGFSITVPSSTSDYLYLQDSTGARSNYIIGSGVGGTADGLNLWDASGNTMIASFSKQSIRFYQNVVGPVFDTGGALTSTLNAATFGVGSDSKESRIQAAIITASQQGLARVYIPASMYPYLASSVSFINTVQMVREGGSTDVYDVLAYGAGGDGVRDDTAAIRAAASAVAANQGTLVFPAPKTFLFDSFPISANYCHINAAGATLKPSGVALKAIYTDNASSTAVGTATFINYWTWEGGTLDMSLMPQGQTTFGFYAKYSYGNSMKNLVVVNPSGYSWSLGMGNGCYTTHFENCKFDRVLMQGAASPETITTILFTNLDSIGTVDLQYCSTITFFHAVTQGASLEHFKIYGCTDITWIGGDHEASNYSPLGTVSAAGGAATFSTSQNGFILNGKIIYVGATPYTVSAFNGTTSCTLSGAPTFGASAYKIATILFNFIDVGNTNMYEAASTLNGFLGQFKLGAPAGNADFNSEFHNTNNSDPSSGGRYNRKFGGRLVYDSLTNWWSFTGLIPRPSPGGIDIGLSPLMHSNNVGYYTGDANDGTGQSLVKTLIRDGSNDVWLGIPDANIASGVKLAAANRGVRAWTNVGGGVLVDVGGWTQAGQLELMTVGQGLSIKEGTNAKMGAAVLVAGTSVVSTTAVNASSRIFLMCQYPGGTPGWLQVSARSNSTSFTILSSNGADTSIVAWIMVEPS